MTLYCVLSVVISLPHCCSTVVFIIKPLPDQIFLQQLVCCLKVLYVDWYEGASSVKYISSCFLCLCVAAISPFVCFTPFPFLFSVTTNYVSRYWSTKNVFNFQRSASTKWLRTTVSRLQFIEIRLTVALVQPLWLEFTKMVSIAYVHAQSVDGRRQRCSL